MCVELQRVRTLVPEEGGGLYRVRLTPAALSYTGFKVHKDGAFLVTPVIKGHKCPLSLQSKRPTVGIQSDFRSPVCRVIPATVE